MSTVLAALLGIVTGLVVANAPTANGAVMLLGTVVGAVLYAAVQDIAADHRDMKRGAPAGKQTRPSGDHSDRGVMVDG